MGMYTAYTLCAWGPGGRHLSTTEKEVLQDWIFDEGVEDCGCDKRNDTPLVMSFCDTSFHAYERVREALSSWAVINPEWTLQLEYDCEDADAHQLIRFRDNDVEEVDRVTYYPEFKRITSPA